MTTRIKLRRDTAANWTTANPILAAGEPGLETDTGKIKYGDGVTAWDSLTHAGGDLLVNAGAITVETGDADRWLIRLRREDDIQNPQWQGVIVYSTNYDSEGNALVVANVDLQNDGIAVFKFTSAGELVWKKSIGGYANTYWMGSNNAVVDADDNLIFSMSSDSYTATIVKVNGSTGAIVFSNAVDMGASYSLNAIGVDSDSKIIIGGNIYISEQTAFVAKLNATATAIAWQKTLTGDSSNSDINALEVDFNDDIIVVGSADVVSQVNGNDVTENQILVAKITSAGTQAWQKVLQLNNESGGAAAGLSLDSVGNIYVTGSYVVDGGQQQEWGGRRSNAVVVFKMTTLGVVSWDRRIGPGECDWVGVSTAVGDDGDLYIYASTYELNPVGDHDNGASGYWTSRLVLARYNKTTGAVIWQSYFDNPLAQEVPGYGNDAPWGGVATDLMSVKDSKILIGGAVRLGQSGADLGSPWENSQYFNQGFLAQFDTDATKFSAEGWTLTTSRIPGKLTNTLEAVTGPCSFQNDIDMTADGTVTISTFDAGISVRRTTSRVNTWTFGKDGTFTAAQDANIRLQQTQLGYINLYGVWNQDNDSIWYESVCHDSDGNAYILGSNYWQSDRAHIQKFSPEGNLIWKRQLHSGEGASFYVEWSSNVYTLATVQNNGSGYKVGDRIVISGGQLGGTDGVNSLTLEVATINDSGNGDYAGGVDTVTIVSGVAPDGSSDAGGLQDYYDDAECQVKTMAYDPVTGNIIVVITTPTYNGDTLDNEWTETVALMIDSGSGTVVNSKTLADEGDVYPYDVNVSSTGKIAIVGEKFNEYTEYGAITPLEGSATDILWVTKSDIDAEHYPGEPNGNYYDWWITGSNITDQSQVQNVNYYYNVPVSAGAQTGSGLVVDVTVAGGAYTVVNTNGTGAGYKNYQKFRIHGDLLGGAVGTNDLTFKVGVDGGGNPNLITNIEGTAAGSDTTYTGLTPTKVPGSGAGITVQFSPEDGSYQYYNIVQQGQDYLVGDTVIIPGTVLAGGQVTTNDIIFNIDYVGAASAGNITGLSYVSGAHPSTHLSIRTDDNVAFDAVGETFAIKQNLGGEAFIWTPDFTKAIGGNNSDWFSGVVWDSTGANLYAVGSGRYEVTYDQALVVKYSSTGTLVASKYVNDSMGNNSADRGAVALMADDSIVVVHDMYNNERGQTNEILVTKLDSNLNILWQQFIGHESDDGWESPDSQISVAVDPVTDEIVIAWESTDYSNLIDDDAILIVKLDTDGEMLWKRLFGIYESDTNLNYTGPGNKALSIHGDKFTIVGSTDGPSDNTDNAFIVTLPLDGTGTGLHDIWTYAELNDNRIQIQRITDPAAATFTPTVHSNGITMTEDVKYYYTDYPEEDFTLYPTVIRSNEGGAIEFADGSKQTFSTALVPQVTIGENRYTLRPEDSGRHILVTSSDYSIVIPNWKKTTLPIGFTVTIINITDGNDVYVENESTNGYQGEMWFSGGDDKTAYVGIRDNGSGQMVTLIKIKEGTYSDDGDQHGDIWMIAGADIYNNN